MPRLPTRTHADDASTKGRTLPHVRSQAVAEQRRIAHLAAGGHTAVQIAAIEGVEPEHVETLLGDEAFGRLVRAYKVMEARPPEERRAELVRIAQFLIDEAIGLGHVRVAFFVVREELNGRDAAETVADKLIRQHAKAAEPPPPAPPTADPATAPTAKRPHLPAHPADRMAQRACRDLVRALLAEFRLRAEAKARQARDAVLAATVRTASPGSPAGWQRRLATRLLTSAAAAVMPSTCPPKLAQAP